MELLNWLVKIQSSSRDAVLMILTYISQAQGNLKKILQRESAEKFARNGSD
jgi:hypothetical protein